MSFDEWSDSSPECYYAYSWQVWDAAQAEMKERCAKWAEMWDSEPLSGQSIAAGIRALNEEK